MKFKRHIKLEYGLGPIDIAPLMNVMFLILLFFILSSFLTFQSGINVKLPKTVTSEAIKEENYVVTITSEDIIYLNGVVTTFKELEKSLNQLESKNHPILIKADRRASVGRIVDIWDLCRRLGIEKLNIATNQDK